MKLYYSPGACSIGIHFLLEEIGAPYETAPIILKQGQQFTDDYFLVNPKSKVPVLLRDDGSVLTEFGAIATWLGHSFPDRNLGASDLEGEVRMIEMLDYAVATIHMQGFSRMLRPPKFAPNDSDADWVRETGNGIVTKAFNHISHKLGDKEFIMGDQLKIADCALFYTLFWGIDRLRLDLPGNVADYYARLRARPSAQKVFADEGIVFD